MIGHARESKCRLVSLLHEDGAGAQRLYGLAGTAVPKSRLSAERSTPNYQTEGRVEGRVVII